MKRLVLATAVASFLSLSGCGGSSGGSSSSSSSAGATVSGTASKGIVSGAVVEAFVFVDGVADTSGTPIASATTDVNGDYSLSIPAVHDGKPLFVRIRSASGTTMKCDIAGGCDADGDPATTDDITPFGANLTLAENALEMSAVLPQATRTVAVNVTPLTTVAAELARSAIGAGASTNSTSLAIARANSQVSTTFGLGADITKIPVVDLTSTDEVEASAGSDDSAINYAAINAAIVKAKQIDASGAGSPLSLGAAISRYAEELVADGGVIVNASDDDDTSLEDILNAAIAVLDEVNTSVSDSVAEGDLDDDLSDAESAPETTTGALDEPSDTSGLLGNYAKVKAFVEELRELGTAIDGAVVTSSAGDELGTVEAILDGFDMQVDAADMMSSTAAEAAFSILGEAFESMADVYDAQVDEVGVDLPAAGTYVSPDGIEVVISVSPSGVVSLDIDQATEVTVDGVSVAANADLTAVLTDLTVDNTVVDTPADVFISSQLPGVYSYYVFGDSDAGVVTLAAGGTGTIAFGDTSESINWSVVDESLVLIFTSGNTESLSITSGDAYYADLAVDYTTSTGTTPLEATWYRTDDYTRTASGAFNGALDFNLNGTVATDALTLEIVNGSATAALESTVDETDTFAGTGTDDNDFLLTGLDLDLDASLTQIARGEVSDPLTFTGGIALSLSRLEVSEVGEYDYSRPPFSDTYTITYETLGIFGLTLEGSVANTTGEAFDLMFDLSLDGTGVPAYSETFDESGFRSDKVATSGGETSSNFVDVTLALQFNAELEGVSDAMELDFEISRVGFDDVDARLDMHYPGRDIAVVASARNLDTDDSANGEMTITNVNDGVVIFVTGDDAAAVEEDEILVAIRMDTNADGTVDEDDFLFGEKVVRGGIEILQFVDEDDPDNIEFESLF